MSDIEQLKILIIILVGIFITIHIVGNLNGRPNNNEYINNNANRDDIKRLSNKIEKETLLLETMKIKKEEVENEIEKLKIEGSTDFEKDIQNETKIKKLTLQVKQTDMRIKEKEEEIIILKNELIGMK